MDQDSTQWKEVWRPSNIYGQEEGLENYSAANTGYIYWRKKDNPEGGTKSPKTETKSHRDSLPGSGLSPACTQPEYRPVTVVCLPTLTLNFNQECLLQLAYDCCIIVCWECAGQTTLVHRSSDKDGDGGGWYSRNCT